MVCNWRDLEVSQTVVASVISGLDMDALFAEIIFWLLAQELWSSRFHFGPANCFSHLFFSSFGHSPPPPLPLLRHHCSFWGWHCECRRRLSVEAWPEWMEWPWTQAIFCGSISPRGKRWCSHFERVLTLCVLIGLLVVVHYRQLKDGCCHLLTWLQSVRHISVSATRLLSLNFFRTTWNILYHSLLIAETDALILAESFKSHY